MFSKNNEWYELQTFLIRINQSRGERVRHQNHSIGFAPACNIVHTHTYRNRFSLIVVSSTVRRCDENYF